MGNCPDDGIITGFKSAHSNAKEDRIWMFRCCKAKKPGRTCRWSGILNEKLTRKTWAFDSIDLNNIWTHIGEGQAIVGLFSFYNSKYSDRQWKIKVCDFGEYQYENPGYVNVHDNSLMYRCPYGMHIYRISADWHKDRNDRRFRYMCHTGLLPETVAEQNCTESDWVNGFGGNPVNPWLCPSNQVIVGFESHHSNSKEDRIWKVHCCQVLDQFMKTDNMEGADYQKVVEHADTCKELTGTGPSGWTPFAKDWDITVEATTSAFVGFRKTHSGNKKDSKWKWITCDYTPVGK